MKKNSKLILISAILIPILLLFGCNKGDDALPKDPPQEIEEDIVENDLDNTKQEEPNESIEVEETDEMAEEMKDPYADILEKAPVEPMNIEEIVAYPTGPLAGYDYRYDKEYMKGVIKDTLPPIEEEKDEEYLDSWWRAYRYLFAENYPDPNQIITKMNLEQFGQPGVSDERFMFKNQINVLVILDVSGSMANDINGKSMMNIAKESISDFTSSLPDEANVGLRVYGHEGQSTGKTKEQSCEISELVYDIQPINTNEFNQVINQFEPTGWTPIAYSLNEVKNDFAAFPGAENTNLVYVVSDGAETCGGDPVAVAEELTKSEIQPIINVIGFNVDIEGQSHLREIAEAGGGLYTNVGNEEQLQEAFNQAKELLGKWEEWKKGAELNAHDLKSKLTVESRELKIEWGTLNRKEHSNINILNGELLSDEFITKDAYNFFLTKIGERYDLYLDKTNQNLSDLLEDIDKNYENLMIEIEEEFNENTGE